MRPALAGSLYNDHANHTSNSGFEPKTWVDLKQEANWSESVGLLIAHRELVSINIHKVGVNLPCPC